MSLTYYDHTLGKLRIKRRYMWATWAFFGGTLAGFLGLMLLR